jgi:hypothetical protein
MTYDDQPSGIVSIVSPNISFQDPISGAKSQVAKTGSGQTRETLRKRIVFPHRDQIAARSRTQIPVRTVKNQSAVTAIVR